MRIHKMVALIVLTTFSQHARSQSVPTSGMNDITVLSVDIGHFDYGHKIIHVYENSRNQSEFPNSPEKWQFVIEPLLSTTDYETSGTVDHRVFTLDPIYEKIEGHPYVRLKHRVLVPVELINDWAREQALDVALAAYPGARCKIGRANVDVLPLTGFTLESSDIEIPGNLMNKSVTIHGKTANFLTSPKEFFLGFDVIEGLGSKDQELNRFISFFPYMQIAASVSFSVKSTKFNITSIAGDKIKSTSLYVKLNGQGGVGYVTRDDLRRLIVGAVNELHASAIVEDPDNFSKDILSSMLASSQSVTADETFFNDQRGAQTFNADDLKPDVITKELNKMFTKETGKDQWHYTASASANASLLGLVSGGFNGSLSGEQLHEFLHEHNIESEIDGDKIVAKSIQVQRINLSDLVQTFNFAMEYRNISGSEKNDLRTVVFGEPVHPPKASVTAFSSITGSCPNAQQLLLKKN